MLSYRHAFHAGSFADVLKHAVLVHALRHAVVKPKAIYFLDTHAGAGSYDLASAMAQKTGEFRGGIERVLAAGGEVPELLRPYLDLVRAANRPGELRAYPGSPALAWAVLRPQDRIELIELHGTDHAALAAWTAPGTTARREDGLAALARRLPPPSAGGWCSSTPATSSRPTTRTWSRRSLLRITASPPVPFCSGIR